MSSYPQRQQHAANNASSSRTQTISYTPTGNNSQDGDQTHHATLRLRGAHDPSGPRVKWAEDVVDNEGLGRKRSKVCCIYHRPKAVDESSDESSSDSSSSSDESDAGDGRRRVPSGDSAGKGKGKGKPRRKEHECDDHDHDHEHDHSHESDRGRSGDGGGGDGDGHARKEKRRPSPNAYERIPKPPKPKNQNVESGKA